MKPLTLHIGPDYGFGFRFSWDLDPTFDAPGQLVFRIFCAPTPGGDWMPVSPQLVNVFNWASPHSFRVNKSAVLYFKVKLDGTDFESEVVQPFGELTKKEFLIGKDIMRRDVLHARKLAGVPNKLLMKSQWGAKCLECMDPITGRSRNSNCPQCGGTGYFHPYHGPYDLWMVYSSDANHRQIESPQTGTVEVKNFSARCVACPPVRQNDVVIDVRSNKRYFVSSVSVISEIRRIPILENLQLAEAPVTDSIYKLKV